MSGPRDNYSLRDIDRGPAKPLIQGDVATFCRQCKEDVLLIGRIRELGDGKRTITGECPNCGVLLVRAYYPPTPAKNISEEFIEFFGVTLQPVIDLIEQHPFRWIIAGFAVVYLLGAGISRILN